MGDSLTLAGIELLGSTVSVAPGAEGAIFYLGDAYDLSAPAMTSDAVAGLLLDGEQVVNLRASNRTPTLPIVIRVPATGDQAADRLTLSAARELVLQTAARERWHLIWTRDGGLPLTFDCQGLSSVVVTHSLKQSQALISTVEVTFAAHPYGRSDDEETVLFAAPSQTFDQPVSSVTIDAFGTAVNYQTGDNATFEGGIGTWANGSGCTVARTTAQAHAGVGALAMTSTTTGSVNAVSCNATQLTTNGIPCNQGDVVTGKIWFRAATIARTVNCAIGFFTANGVQLSGSPVHGTGVTDSTTAWTQATVTATAPVGTAFCRLAPQVTSVASGETHYLDDAYMDRGSVMSGNDSGLWTASALTAVSGSGSAFWSRAKGDAPLYDRALPTPIDITGRTKFSFWLGLATSISAYKNWHKGPATVRITMTDASGDLLKFGAKRVEVLASALQNKPHWQHISAAIPQNVPNFDYTNVTRYSIQVWNTWNTFRTQPDLQASAYLCNVVASATTTGSPGTRGGWYTFPGIVGTARAPIALQASPGPSSFSTVVEFTAVGTNNWTSAVGQTSIDKVEAWAGGGGGAGGDNGGNNPGGAGGGGEYAMDLNVPVTASTVYHPVVGGGGSGGTANVTNQTDGDDSWFIGNSNRTTYAHGGFEGFRTQSWGGGKGGSGSTSYVHHPGGDGYQANVATPGTRRGGGGGGSGGPGGSGLDGNGGTGAPQVSGGGPGGEGGHTSLAFGPFTGSSPTTGPGGGGGGGANEAGGSHNGANGANGKIRLTYGASGILPMNSLLVHMPNQHAPSAFSPLCPVGNGADTPNGGTEYTVPPVGGGALPARFDGSYSLWLIASAWNTPSAARTLTVTVKQYAYAGGPSTTQQLIRTVTPNNDVVNGYADMGVITLPLWDLPPGNADAFFVVTVLDSNTADRFYDVIFIDTQGQTVFVNMPGTAFANLIWIDEAEQGRDLGRILASDLDRDRARSIIGSDPSNRISGGPLSVVPDAHNRMLVYQAQGVPSVMASYLPRWWEDRLA